MRKFLLLFLALTLMVFPQHAAAQAAGPVYIVQPGDTLSSIAARFNVTVEELIAANGTTDPNLLAAGQQLIIPGLEGVTGILNTKVINFGDSFRAISRQTQVPVALLQKLNRLVSPTELYIGASLIVPQDEGETGLTAHFTPQPGETLLEMAVRQNSDVWTLASLNALTGGWSALPGDVLYAPGGAGGQSASGLPPAFVSAEVTTLPVKQGGTAVIVVEPARQDIALGGILVDMPLHFFPLDDGRQVALQGVHALLEPGVYPLRLDATFPDASVQSFEQNILIVSGNYLTDPDLYVPAETIDPVNTAPEQNQVVSIVSGATPQRFWQGPFTTPASLYAESTYFTSRFGSRRLYIGQGTDLKIQSFHTGVDFGGGTGLPITAPAPGVVVFTGPLTVRGNATIIDHGWGVYSGFWHQSEFKVQVGDVVEQGQIIGLVGGTGRVTGAHLHWELWVNGVQVEPLDWLNRQYP
ncbi:MAG: LysM peptidoglycan-binding domain-containing protein [Chloroflexota bacterium]